MEKKIVSKTQIEDWKKKYGKVYKVEVDGKEAYLRTPDRRILAMVAAMAGNDGIKYNEAILKNCWLAGDEEIQTNDSLFLGVSAKLPDLIDIKEAELKEV